LFAKLILETAPVWAPVVAGMLGALVVHLGAWLIQKLLANKKLYPLAEAVEVGEEVLQAGLTAAGQSPNQGAPKAVLGALEASLEANKAKLADSAKAEITVLTSPPAQLTVIAPGGGVVNLPEATNAGWAKPEA